MLFKDANEPLLSLEDDESVNNDRETEFRSEIMFQILSFKHSPKKSVKFLEL